MINSLSDLLDIARSKCVQRLSVAAADDHTVLQAVKSAIHEGFILPILVGNKSKILKISDEIRLDVPSIEIIDEKDPYVIARKAVSLVNDGSADILMKGLIGTAPMLKAVVNRESGLRTKTMLSHFCLFETKHYHKLFAVSDVGMNISPNLDEKVQIVQNAIDVMHALGVTRPKVALISPAETINPKIESSLHASIITMMNRRNQITECIIDGPLALDNAISSYASDHKGIVSEVAGDADILIVPDLDSGNILYKALTFMGGASSAAIVTGAKAPIVLTSRAASDQSKLYSMALAAVLK